MRALQKLEKRTNKGRYFFFFLPIIPAAARLRGIAVEGGLKKKSFLQDFEKFNFWRNPPGNSAGSQFTVGYVQYFCRNFLQEYPAESLNEFLAKVLQESYRSLAGILLLAKFL